MRGLTLWAAGLVLACSMGCSGPDPNSPQAAFESLIQAVEDGNADKMETLLAPDFVGETTRAATVVLAREWLRRDSSRDISIRDFHVREQGNNATITATVTLTSKGPGIFPRYMSQWHVETQWRRGVGGWKVRVGQWSRIR